ncbi:hypothetical protein SOPP22_10175 [Shewanella sp. OPT22]|nr:hypothetical protein SOPP22_10175 [Shewanella sp. OPT22]
MTEQQDSYFSKGSAIVFLTFIGGFITAYIFNVTFSRALGPVGYGDYKVAEAFLSLGSMVALMGGGKAVAKFLPDQIEGNCEGVWDYTKFYTIIIAGVSLILAGLVVLCHELHFAFEDNDEYHPLLLTTLAIPTFAFATLLGGILLVAKRLELAFIPWRIGNPGLRLIFGLIYLFFVGSLNSYEAVIIMTLSSAIIALYCFYKVKALALMPITPVDNFIEPKKWLSVSFPMMMIIVLQAMTKQLDIYMLEYMSSEISVGHFAAAQTTANSIATMQLAIFGLVSPLIVPALKKGKLYVAQINRKSFKIVLWIVIPLCAILIYFAHPILEIYGHDTQHTYLGLIILVLGYGISCIFGMSTIFLQYTGKEQTVTFIMILSVLLNAVLNAVLIPIIDVEGAAIATGAAMIFNVVVTGAYMYKHLGILPWSLNCKTA